MGLESTGRWPFHGLLFSVSYPVNRRDRPPYGIVQDQIVPLEGHSTDGGCFMKEDNTTKYRLCVFFMTKNSARPGPHYSPRKRSFTCLSIRQGTVKEHLKRTFLHVSTGTEHPRVIRWGKKAEWKSELAEFPNYKESNVCTIFIILRPVIKRVTLPLIGYFHKSHNTVHFRGLFALNNGYPVHWSMMQSQE